MPAASQVMLAIGGSLVASIIAKATVAIAIALTAAWLARGTRASVRHVLLASAFGAILLLPVGSLVEPPVHLAVPNQPFALPPHIATVVDRIPLAATAVNLPAAPAISVRHAPTISLSALLLTVWIAGVAIFLLPLMIGLWQVRSLHQAGLPWRHGQSVAEAIACEAGVRRSVALMLHEEVAGPMTCGIVHPVIVLPLDAESWDEESLQRAIVHELEHIRRSDSVTRCLARVACAVYWFHPLVWIAWRNFVLEAERSCDDAVLERSDATAYADQLVGLAKHLLAARKLPLLAMANRADLSTRVGALLDARQRRGRAGIFAPALACAIAAVLVVAMSPLRLIAAPQAAPAQTVTTPVTPVDPKPASLPLMAQAQPPKVDRPVSPAAPKVEAPVAFEVASVRPSPAGAGRGGQARGGPGTSDPERLTYEHVLFRRLLMDAYGVQLDQIKGPDWATADLRDGGAIFDISAKVPPGATKQQVAIMLQNLLKERFHLALHHETTQSSGYALVVAKGGSKLKESAGPLSESERGKPVTGPVNLQTEKDGFPQLFPEHKMGGTFKNGTVRMRLRDYSLFDLVEQFSFALDIHLIDRTGLGGKYDFTLEFTPPEDGNTVGILATLPLAPGQTAPLRGNGPEPGQLDSIPAVSSAMEKQLGLKLETAKIAVDMLVIDHAEKTPAEN